MSELAKFNDFHQMLEMMDDTQLDMIQKRITSMQLAKLDRALTEVTEEVEKIKESQKIEREMQEKQLELERKRHRVAENRFGYIGLSDLGKQFNVTIASKTMGSLLRVVGIAKSKQSITEPYAVLIRDGFAKSQDTQWGGVIWQWNSEKCIAKIDRWLEKHDLIDHFYSIDNEKELMKFIKELEERYS